MPEFMERLNQAIQLRETTAAELARDSDVAEAAISQYRKGKYKASQTNLEHLAEALNVSVAWLMGADVPMERENPRYRVELSKKTASILEEFDYCEDDELKGKVIEILQKLNLIFGIRRELSSETHLLSVDSAEGRQRSFSYIRKYIKRVNKLSSEISVLSFEISQTIQEKALEDFNNPNDSED